MEDIVDVKVSDELSPVLVEGDAGVFGTVSLSALLFDGVMALEFAEDLRPVGKFRVRVNSRGLFARGVDVPDRGGAETSLGFLETLSETKRSSEPTLSLFLNLPSPSARQPV